MSTHAQYPSLKERTVLITGGAAGIGASLTSAFIAQGARVGFLDYDRDAAEVLMAENNSSNLHFEYCDIRDIDALRAAINGVSAALGPINILINNAARDDRHSIESVTPEYWDCLLYTSPSPRDLSTSRMPSSA